jgi:hypothetical protein
MLGFYANFPDNIHRAETFSSLVSCKKLQEALVETLYRLNSENPCLEEVAAPSVPGCKIISRSELLRATASIFWTLKRGKGCWRL